MPRPSQTPAPDDLLDEAVLEATRAGMSAPPESDLARRQAAEKIWGYVASELNRSFRAAGLAVESGGGAHEDRKRWLRDIDRRRGTRFLATHNEYAELHGDCFYESQCPTPQALKTKAAEARRFVEEVRRAVEEARLRAG